VIEVGRDEGGINGDSMSGDRDVEVLNPYTAAFKSG